LSVVTACFVMKLYTGSSKSLIIDNTIVMQGKYDNFLKTIT